MILLHRITPFVLGLVIATGFVLAINFPNLALQVIVGTLLISLLLSGRLAGWEGKSYQFWNFVLSPLLFVAAAFVLLLFLENTTEKTLLATVTSLGVFLYTEHIFNFLYTPTRYKTNSIEHLSLVMYVLTAFYLSAACFGLILFVNVNLFLLAPVFFLLILFVVYSMLWISKIEHRRAFSYAIAGAIIATELFLAASFLPSGFYTNAALLAVFVYLFLGINRAHVLDKLNQKIFLRYAVLSSLMLLAVVGSAKWI